MHEPKQAGRGWVGFDLDGTLIKHCTQEEVVRYILGEPIAEVVQLMHKEKANGYELKIFTARVSMGCNPLEHTMARRIFVIKQTKAIQEWSKIKFGEIYDVTCQKDFNCIRIYDDRAMRVICDTGKLCCER